MATEEEKTEVLGRIGRGEIGNLSPEKRKRALALYSERFNAQSSEKTKTRRDEILASGENMIAPPSTGDKLKAALDPEKMVDDAKAGTLAAANTFTLGANSAVNRALGTSEEDEAAVLEGSGDKLGGIGAADVGGMAGTAAGSVAGPAAGIARATAPAAPLVREGASKLAQAGGRVAQSAASGAGGGLAQGATEGALEAAGRGESPLDILGEAARRGRDTGVAGAVAGGAISTAGEAATATRGALRSGEGRTSRYLREKDRGTFDDPEMKALPKAEKGIAKAAEKSRDKMIKRDSDLVTTARVKQAGEKEAAAARSPMVKANTTISAVDELETLAAEDPSLAPMLKEARRILGVNPARFEGGVGTKPITEIDRTEVPTEKLFKLRELLRERRGNGVPQGQLTAEQRAARKLQGTLSDELHAKVPGLAEADAEFSGVKTRSERFNDFLVRSEQGANRKPGEVLDDVADDIPVDADAGIDARAAKEAGAAQRLARAGDTSNAALFEESRLNEIAAADPEMAKAIEFVKNKKALEASRLSLSDPNTTNARRLSVAAADALRRNATSQGMKATDVTAAAGQRMSELFGIQRPPAGVPAPSGPRPPISSTTAPGAPGRATMFEILSEAAKRREEERRP